MAKILEQVDLLARQLKDFQPLSVENQQKLDKKIRLEFNYNSNHMEGNTLTYSETELLLIFDDTKGSHTMREYEEMKAHDAAYRLIVELASDKEHPLTEQNIKNLNEIILVKPFWKDAITPDGQDTRRQIKIGSYKEHPNSVRLQNGEMFNYASPTDTPILMKELIEWYRNEEKNLDPVTLATMLHYKFVRIHPFDDGNGRVARLLMNYVLLRSGYPPVIIKSADKANYLRVLRLADVEDFEPLISYVADQLIWILQISIKAAKGESVDEPGDLDKKLKALKQRLNTDENARVRITRSNSAIITAYESSIQPLISALAQKLLEFSPLFKSTAENLLVYDISDRQFAMSKDLLTFKQEATNIPYTIKSMVYEYSFSNLRKGLKKNFSTHVSLQFLFHSNLYEVVSESIKSQADKLYDEKYSEMEIKLIIEEAGSFIVGNIEMALDKQ